jgi:NADH-quinone oxidoreductase subunit N
VGKFYLFRTAIDGGFVGLAIIGVLTSLVSAFYYLRVVVNMYMRDGEPEAERDLGLNFTVISTAIATVGLSLVPQWVFLLASNGSVAQWQSSCLLSNWFWVQVPTESPKPSV